MFRQAWQRLKNHLPIFNGSPSKEKPGLVASGEDIWRRRYRVDVFTGNARLRQTIQVVKEMNRDPRIQRIHQQTAKDTVKGGLRLVLTGRQPRLQREWKALERRLGWNNFNKLYSDCKGFLLEGNVFLQLLMGEEALIHRAVRMPAESMLANANESGTFTTPLEAFIHYDTTTGTELMRLPLYKVAYARLEPENFDDVGSAGQPFLFAMSDHLNKLQLLEESLVERRHTRATPRMLHILENANKEDLDHYREEVENIYRSGRAARDFYTNRKGSIHAVSVDAKLEEIGDLMYLFDAVFPSAPSVYGYHADIPRDVLEELRKQYYQQVDGIQDALSSAYREIFERQLLLKGIDPSRYEFEVCFAERMTMTRNQQADLALKWQALGLPEQLVWESAGVDVERAAALREAEERAQDAYPMPTEVATPESATPTPQVNVTPGNAPSGESATTISTRS